MKSPSRPVTPRMTRAQEAGGSGLAGFSVKLDFRRTLPLNSDINQSLTTLTSISTTIFHDQLFLKNINSICLSDLQSILMNTMRDLGLDG